MADTPLHEHEAVKHLMGTEHWPKQPGLMPPELPDIPLQRHELTGCWGFFINGDVSTNHIPTHAAHSLITLAAVRGMAAKGWYTRTRWCGDSGHPACCEAVQLGGYRPLIRAFAGLTEPLAILAAYQATVMEGGK